MARARYDVVSITPEIVTVQDENGPVSVTNDAETVVREVAEQYPGKRIWYFDSDGNLDELLHDNGVFKGFAPVSNVRRDQL